MMELEFYMFALFSFLVPFLVKEREIKRNKYHSQM